MTSDIALDSEQIIRCAYKIAEDKDIEGWIAAFTEDGFFTDQSIGASYQGPDELPITVGEWAAPRVLTVQFRDIHGIDVDEFGRPDARWWCLRPASPAATWSTHTVARPSGVHHERLQDFGRRAQHGPRCCR